MPRYLYNIVPGFFNQTLASIVVKNAPSRNIAIYIDCDLNSSTRTVLEFLRPRLKYEMIIAFDNYYCWSQAQNSGEKMALLEFAADNSAWSFSPCVQIGWYCQSFVIENISQQVDNG